MTEFLIQITGTPVSFLIAEFEKHACDIEGLIIGHVLQSSKQKISDGSSQPSATSTSTVAVVSSFLVTGPAGCLLHADSSLNTDRIRRCLQAVQPFGEVLGCFSFRSSTAVVPTVKDTLLYLHLKNAFQQSSPFVFGCFSKMLSDNPALITYEYAFCDPSVPGLPPFAYEIVNLGRGNAVSTHDSSSSHAKTGSTSSDGMSSSVSRLVQHSHGQFQTAGIESLQAIFGGDRRIYDAMSSTKRVQKSVEYVRNLVVFSLRMLREKMEEMHSDDSDDTMRD
jgi:hypothetical protein